MTTSQRLVILDRDGVINQDSDEYVKCLSEWHPYPSAIDAIARLSKAGWLVAVATNQSGISRGYLDPSQLEAMHRELNHRVDVAGGKISLITFCPHGPDDLCSCRKPAPGMLFEIRDLLGFDTLKGSWMVGDSLRDLQAGQAAGCKTALVKTGKGVKTLDTGKGLEDTRIFDDLAAFVDWLLANHSVHLEQLSST
jgi:D-glycero-D-manno-heptose 1,7-bisphosphate phosphatase